MNPLRPLLLVTCTLLIPASEALSETSIDLQLRSQQVAEEGSQRYVTSSRSEHWLASETAIIVCDVWDYHHCFNAVRRLEQFVPRLNDVLTEARRRGVTIIHSPSDCMDAYRDHPARLRALQAPTASHLPHDIESWCSVIPAEERGAYPIDQSDGGEDDDPQEHAEWAAKLKSLGRNPNMPWQRQSDLLTIDADADFISDRGDEVWNILAQQGIANVILAGVHTNMCVLGRPFGLRQMARNGKNVVLMRDMTDTMYNPKQWPYVSHFEGTRRIISHIEQFVCPTITSDQLIGGDEFRFAGDSGEREPKTVDANPESAWTTVSLPLPGQAAAPHQPQWYRCVVRIPQGWLDDPVALKCRGGDQPMKAWINGHELQGRRKGSGVTSFEISPDAIEADAIEADDANLMVLRLTRGSLGGAPVISSGSNKLALAGRWQYRLGDEPSFSNMPLPAKFGGSTDIVFTTEDPLWTPRAVTRPGEFTTGIEGPACDRDGNVFAVNYARQGTIGRVRPSGQGEVFVELPQGSIGNGIRFAPDGTFFVADYMGHNVLRVDPVSRQISVHAHHAEMNQPNDLSLAPDGKTLYASDPNWSAGSGQLWRIDDDGSVTLLATDLGTTNGIEVSPTGSTLYVNESKQRNVWAFKITADKTLSDKRLIRQFEDHGFDGMRCDVDGNLYITRYGKGTVVKMTPEGKILREIPVLGMRPSNVCFGGPDRRTAYVTEVESRRLVSFRVDRPGRN
jgi:sugar lactone lactonase YvrE/nicotinamidase-related amidase